MANRNYVVEILSKRNMMANSGNRNYIVENYSREQLRNYPVKVKNNSGITGNRLRKYWVKGI